MNFIKKKLKSHKKDDEEEEYEKAVYEQSLHSHQPDQKNKNTEEWQFFQQLSMKVQDTVQKTQTTLNKLKDSNVPNDDEFFEADNDGLPKETTLYGPSKVLRAPPRPPAPSGDKTSLPIDLDFGSDFSQSSTSKLPPRPPPPGFSDLSFSSDTSALHGTPNKSFASPARPPPPNNEKGEHTNVAFREATVKSALPDLTSKKNIESFNLLDEFGFQSDTTTITSNANFQDLLFLDEKEEVDPFDTSFVDVSTITSTLSLAERKRNEPISKISENSFNPFTSSSPSSCQLNWMTNSPDSDKSKKTVTNPFFNGVGNNIQPELHPENNQSGFPHNPFSFNDSKNVGSSQDDFFGITIEPSQSNKDNITDDLFHTNEDSPKSPTFECKGFVNSAFNDNIEPELEREVSDTFSKRLENPPNPDQIESLINEVDICNTYIMNETNTFSGDANNLSNRENSKHSSLLWDTDNLKTETLISEQINEEIKVKETFDSFKNTEENCSQNKLLSSIEMASYSHQGISDENTLPSALNDLSILSHPKEKNTEVFDSTSKDTLSDVYSNFTEVSEIVTEQIESITQKESSLQSVSVSACESIPEKEIIPRKDSIPRRESIHHRESIPQNESISRRESIPQNESLSRRESIPQKESISRRESIPQKETTSRRESIPLKESIPQRESIPKKETLSRKESISAGFSEKENILSNFPQENQTAFSEDLSKPFEEETDKNAFFFKVKSAENKSDIEFDAFAAKFDSVKDNQDSNAFDPFMSKKAPTLKKIQDNYKGFESMDEFDPFCVSSKVEASTSMMKKEPSRDSFEDYDNEVDFSVVIKPKVKDSSDIKISTMEPPKLLPPPKTPTKAFESIGSRFNPFDKDSLESSEISKITEKVSEAVEVDEEPVPALGEAGVRKADSVETPLSPLFDEDTSQPLEIYPKPYEKEGWEMVLRQPNKKKLTGNRFWKKIFVKLSENSVLQLFNKIDDKLPFQELPLQGSSNKIRQNMAQNWNSNILMLNFNLY